MARTKRIDVEQRAEAASIAWMRHQTTVYDEIKIPRVKGMRHLISSCRMVDAELGFTSDVIRDPKRFVGRTDLISDAIRALNSPLGLIAIYGKRGVGKSSLLRQIQQMALGDYSLAKQANLGHLIPARPRRYLTVFYTCDSLIKNGESLIARLCNDQDSEDGLLRLVPDDGKELVEFTRSIGVNAGADLKVVKWGAKGIEGTKYARVVEGDTVQTFRNFISSILTHQVQKRMNRDALLILLDEFDVIANKSGLGSVIKSLSTDRLKFAICGVGRDLNALVEDHGSVERLLEEGAVHVKPMPLKEAKRIVQVANDRFAGVIYFNPSVIDQIARLSEGYPYFVQMFGKACVSHAVRERKVIIDDTILRAVLDEVRSGEAFPTLEGQYQRAIGKSDQRQVLLHLLADQPEENALFNQELGRVVLRETRNDAQDLGVEFVDQLIPRLVEAKYGPVLIRLEGQQGVYEFANPVFRVYVKLREW